MNNKKEIYDRLIKFDQELTLIKSEKIKISIVGGAFFIINNFIDRATHDIDIGQINEINNLVILDKNIEDLASKYDINSNCVSYVNGCLELSKEWILHKDLILNKIEIYFPTNEIMVIIKLFASIRAKANIDIKDISSKNFVKKLDFEKIENLFKDYATYFEGSDDSLKAIKQNYKNWKSDIKEI